MICTRSQLISSYSGDSEKGARAVALQLDGDKVEKGFFFGIFLVFAGGWKEFGSCWSNSMEPHERRKKVRNMENLG